MNEQQLYMSNPCFNELRPEQRSSYTFLSLVDAKKKSWLCSREENNSIVYFFSSFGVKEKKKDTTERDNIDGYMSADSLKVYLWLQILMNNLVTHQFFFLLCPLFTDAVQRDCIDLICTYIHKSVVERSTQFSN
jgi:hypothetical protein